MEMQNFQYIKIRILKAVLVFINKTTIDLANQAGPFTIMYYACLFDPFFLLLFIHL